MDPYENHIPIQNSQTPELLAKYLRDIGQGDLLTHAEEIELSKAAKVGEKKARRRLIEKNLRLVASGIASTEYLTSSIVHPRRSASSSSVGSRSSSTETSR